MSNKANGKESRSVEDTAYVLEKVDIEEDVEDNLPYEEMDVSSETTEDEEVDEDLDSALQTMKKGKGQTSPIAKAPESFTQTKSPSLERIPETVDDFLRNWLIKMNLQRTLEMFQTEWYEMILKGKLKEEDIGNVPDAKQFRDEMDKWKTTANKLEEAIEKLKKERDFHRMHHKRVGQEKNKLLTDISILSIKSTILDIKKIQEKYEAYKPQAEEWQAKYEQARKEKVNLQLEKDKLQRKMDEIERNAASKPPQSTTTTTPTKGPASPAARKAPPTASASDGGSSRRKAKEWEISDSRPNPWREKVVNPPSKLAGNVLLRPTKTFKAHQSAISSIALHPSKNFVVTASDDKTWQLWSVPGFEFWMSGEGHKDWISDCDFHPKGTHLATSSGDCTVKIWDFDKGVCVASFTDHNRPVWGCAFHDTGDYVISASADKSCKVFDLNSQSCKTSYYGHKDSVNHVTFQPYTNLFATASADGTVNLWDLRKGVPLKTFRHESAVNHVAFNKKGDQILSTDTNGVITVWDLRMVNQLMSVDTGDYPANKACFDPSGAYAVVPTDEGVIKVYDTQHQGNLVYDLKSHESAVHAVLFDITGESLLSADSNGILCYWT